jgi:imidazolonepropionase-like amidohydrolase
MVLPLFAVLGALVQQPCDSVLAIWNVSVVPMDSARVLPGQTVLVREGRIRQIERAGSRPSNPCWLVVDGTGKYLLPGLADMHVHTRDTSDFMLWLAKGVTTIRILRGSPASLEWRRRSREGLLLAPTIITSGPFTNLPLIRTPLDAWRAAVEQKAAGYDEIKIHGSLESDTYDSLIVYGRRLNIRVVGHIPRNLPFARVLANRQADISHVEEILYGAFRTNLDDTSVAKIPAVSRAIAAAGITVTTSLTTYERIAAQVRDLPPLLVDPANQYVAPSHLESWQPRNNEYLRNFTPNAEWAPRLAARFAFQEKILQGLHAAGVRLMLGTDAVGPLWVPGWMVHAELRALVRNGFTPFEALETATANPAAFLGQAGEFGTVTVGGRADLLLVDANPLTDVRNAERIAGVVVRGRWLPRGELDARLAAIAAANRAEEQRVARLLATGVAAAATRRCRTDLPPLSPEEQRLVDLRVSNGFTDLVADSGVSPAQRVADVVRRECPTAVVFDEGGINGVANALIARNRRADAIMVLRFNSALFPQSFLAPYFLGEALLAGGDTAGAIVAYRKSVENDERMMDAIDRLKQLGAWPVR